MYEKELKHYYREAKPYLFCNKPYRKEFERYIADSAHDFLADKPDASFWELRCMLGEPEEAAGFFMDSLPTGTATHFKRIRRRIRCLVNVLMGTLFLVLFAVVFAFLIKDGIIGIDLKTFESRATQSLYTREKFEEMIERQRRELAEEAAKKAESEEGEEDAGQEVKSETDLELDDIP